MDNCLNCNNELTHIPGRRKKKFCDKDCKAEFLKKNNPYRELTEAGKLVLDYCKEKGITIEELIKDHSQLIFNKVFIGGIDIPKVESESKIGYTREQVNTEMVVDYSVSKTDKHLPGLTSGMKQVKQVKKDIVKPKSNYDRFSIKNKIK